MFDWLFRGIPKKNKINLHEVTTHFVLRDAAGNTLLTRVHKNTITNVGHAVANGPVSYTHLRPYNGC